MDSIVLVRLWQRLLNWSKRETFNFLDQLAVKHKEPSISSNLSSNKEGAFWSICKLDGRYLSPLLSTTLLQMERKLCHLLCMLSARKINTTKPYNRLAVFWSRTIQTKSSPLLALAESQDTCRNKPSIVSPWMEIQWALKLQELPIFCKPTRQHSPKSVFQAPPTSAKSSKLSTPFLLNVLPQRPTTCC